MMANVLTEAGLVLVCLFFTAAGVLMVVSPGTYFRWVSRVGPRSGRVEGIGHGSRWMAFTWWTRFRGLLLLAAMVWVAYHGWLRMR